jgi:hypothetical protein
MLQTSFPKLKKHHPTNLYMLYPMAQSVALFCIEIDKKKALPKHCPLSSSSIIQNHFGARPQHLSVDYCWRSQQHPSVPTTSLTCKVQAHRVNIHIH